MVVTLQTASEINKYVYVCVTNTEYCGNNTNCSDRYVVRPCVAPVYTAVVHLRWWKKSTPIEAW